MRATCHQARLQIAGKELIAILMVNREWVKPKLNGQTGTNKQLQCRGQGGFRLVSVLPENTRGWQVVL